MRLDDPRDRGRRGGGPPDRPRHARPAANDGGRGAHARRRPGPAGPARSWLQRVVLGLGVALVLSCLLGASVAGYTLIQWSRIERADLGDLPQAAAGEPENFLIVAVDTREGQGSKNTDTIMVLRVDPKSDRLALTSFPRDLMVTIADTGRVGMINSAYARESGGERVLIDTLQQNFGIVINHFVEVNFDSFRQVVDAVGGVSVWLDTATRDKGSGLYTEELGCVQLDGTGSLEFVRSRKLEILTDDGWEHDPLSDVNRVKRQQIFIQRALAKVQSQATDLRRLNELVTIGVQNVVLDPNLGMSDILDLAKKFQDFDPGKLETYPLPTVPYPQNENRLLLDELGAEPMLNVFRGLPPGEIGPGLVDVTVLNGTHVDEAQRVENLATDVSAALQKVGFDVATPGDADTFYAQTTIEHAPGQQAVAQRVARHITSDVAIPLVENPELASGDVRLIAGADFTTVHELATPIEAMPAPAGAAPAGEPPAGGEAGAEAPAAGAPAETPDAGGAAEVPVVEEEDNPFIIGAPPEGTSC